MAVQSCLITLIVRFPVSGRYVPFSSERSYFWRLISPFNILIIESSIFYLNVEYSDTHGTNVIVMNVIIRHISKNNIIKNLSDIFRSQSKSRDSVDRKDVVGDGRVSS